MNRGYNSSPSSSSAATPSPPGGPGHGQLRWDHRPAFQDNARNGAPAEYNRSRPIEERPAIRPVGITSTPLEPYPPTRIIIVNGNMGHGISPRLPELRRIINQETMQVPSETPHDDSRLTKEEQEAVLKKLKKEIYNPMPKMLARRVSLYYRDLNRDPNAKALDKRKDEDGKNCAVCLEDFKPREEVMLTPCKHMFHEECIVPWLKNQGQCPVCRSILFERRENGSAFNNNNNNNNRDALFPRQQQGLSADELLSLIQAVDAAFTWGA